MDPLKAIRELVVKETIIDEGKIVAINADGTFLVSTKIGLKSISGDSNLFKIGDSVKVSDGTITSKKSVEDSLVVHEL